jgi:hypothetical protein
MKKTCCRVAETFSGPKTAPKDSRPRPKLTLPPDSTRRTKKNLSPHARAQRLHAAVSTQTLVLCTDSTPPASRLHAAATSLRAAWTGARAPPTAANLPDALPTAAHLPACHPGARSPTAKVLGQRCTGARAPPAWARLCRSLGAASPCKQRLPRPAPAAADLSSQNPSRTLPCLCPWISPLLCSSFALLIFSNICT